MEQKRLNFNDQITENGYLNSLEKQMIKKAKCDF